MREKLTLFMDQEVVSEAESLEMDMQRIAEEAITQAVKLERNRRCVAENRETLDK